MVPLLTSLLPLAFAGFSAGSTLMKIREDNQQLSLQAKQLADQSVRQAASDIAILNARQRQEGTQITLDQVRRFRQGLRERSTLTARLGDAGVAGGSTLRDTISSVIQESIDIQTRETGRTWGEQQIELEKRGARAKGQAGLNRAQQLLGERTTGLSAGLQLIGSGLTGYSQGKQFQRGLSG